MDEMTVLFVLVLITAYLLAGFVFNPALSGTRLKRWALPILGGLLLAGCAYLLLGVWANYSLPLLLFAVYAALEFIRSQLKRSTLAQLVIWLALWGGIIYLVVLRYPSGLYADSWWVSWLGMSYLKGLIIFAGFIFAVFPGSQLIGLALQPLQGEIRKANKKRNTPAGLREGGRWIGMLERALIYIFVLTGQYASIGFLVAAKSILRFGEVKETRNRMDAEYIIIGTLASFLFALLTGLAVVASLE